MIDTTYGEVQQAYNALTALSREGLEVRLAVALKWKRILGLLKPLVQQMDELVNEVLEKHAARDENGKMVEGERPGTVRVADVRAYNEAVSEILKTPVQVGSDQVETADFGDGEKLVSSSLAMSLGDLGAFFKEN